MIVRAADFSADANAAKGSFDRAFHALGNIADALRARCLALAPGGSGRYGGMVNRSLMVRQFIAWSRKSQ